MASYSKKGFTPSPNEAGISKVKHEVPQVVPHEKRYFHNFFRREKSIVPRLVRGFTLIELLIVIAIIAVLAVAVVLVLNPAELLRQSRDTTRISDMNAIKSALGTYLADVAVPNLGVGRTCYLTVATSSCAGFFPTSNVINTSSSKAVDGSGWIPVNFKAMILGSPIGSLPKDPTNDSNFFYAYVASSTTNSFKLAVQLESAKYTTGTLDKVSTDGGISNTFYETGTALGL